jgi:hypothetical protein
MPSNGPREPIIETPTHEPGREETGDRALLRVRQQEILAELGVMALKGTPFDDLLKEAVVLSAQGLEAEFCKVLEYIPAQNRFLMRAGVGWDEGLVGTASWSRPRLAVRLCIAHREAGDFEPSGKRGAV